MGGYLDTAELEDLADRLAEAQPYLAELSRDGSIRGLASILARGARAIRDGDVEPERLAAIYEHTTEALAAAAEGREHHLSWAEVLASRAFEGDPRRKVVFVQPVLRVTDIQPARRSIETGKPLRVKYGMDPTAPDLHLGNALALHKLATFHTSCCVPSVSRTRSITSNPSIAATT